MVIKKRYLDKLIKIHEQLVSILADVAEESETDPDALKKLSMLSDSWVLTCVSLHPKTSSKILEKMLARHSPNAGEDEQWRVHIVGNPALRLSVLQQRSENDPSPDVREAALTALAKRMAQSPNVTAKELFKLYTALSKTRSVSRGKRQKAAREALLKHPKFPRNKVK